ncbi:MAG: rhomboid family intramembrane serine protease [Planctomycetota bacterium]
MSDRDYLRADYDAPRYRAPFWLTLPGMKGYLALLLGMFVLQMLLPRFWPAGSRFIEDYLSLTPHDVLHKFYVWQLVTGTLLHADFLHILFNSLIIFFAGRLVEPRLGSRGFVVFCLGCAAFSSLGYIAWAIFDQVLSPMVGASGVAMGLLILMAIWYPHMTIHLWGLIPLRMKTLAFILIGMDVLMMLSTSGDIANSAHLAGCLFAWLYVRHGAKVAGVFDAIDRRSEVAREKKVAKQHLQEAEMRQEMDRILDKIRDEGMPSLSDAERRRLKEIGQRLRP